MTQFHEGQDVEIADRNTDFGVWIKAKIIAIYDDIGAAIVEFNDGTRRTLDTQHIRALQDDPRLLRPHEIFPPGE
jgi:hypothetical protein